MKPRGHSTLQRRLTWMTALAVALAVLVTGMAAYFFTAWSLYDQLDHELLEVANFESELIVGDWQNMGGLNAPALRAPNVTLVLLMANNTQQLLPRETVHLKLEANELEIARVQAGASIRTGSAIVDGKEVPYRIVAVPLNQRAGTPMEGGPFALVIARQLNPTTTILRQLLLVLTVFGAAMALVSALVGAWVSRQGLGPLRQLSDAVARVTETDQLRPIDTSSVGDDEVTDLARSFNTMMHSLESSRERQRRLIADAGHELRTPLTSLRTNIELLVADDKTGMLPEGARGDILRDVASQLSEFTSLVGDLVQLAREEQVQPSPEPVDLRDVVRNAVTRAQRRGPALVFDIQLHPHFLIGEPDQLERAITNLLDNAVKFSPPGGTVQVRMTSDLLVISDEGPGIAEADLPHIFDRFYRSDQARNTPGTGLGLSIVSHTVNAHGGWVKAGRSASGGAEFTMWLPGSDQEDEEEATMLIPRIG